MSVDFEKRYGVNQGGSNADKPRAKYWLNVGYSTTVMIGTVEEERFISLPLGIPLDTQEKLKVNSKNDDFAAQQTARNHLFEQIMEVAGALKPGEDRLLNLQIQLRAISDDREAITPDANKFIKKLDL
jgi:hypothetical protein